MSDTDYKLEGFIFFDINDYNEAKREAESIEYIRANNDLEDYNKLVKLYHKLTDQNNFKTLVGLTFLKELQERILEEGIISSENLQCIKIDRNMGNHKVLFANQQKNEGQQDPLENYRVKLRNARIISVFLLGIIAVMVLIAVFSDRSVYQNYENKILNKYAAWEEDLNAREKTLQEKEDLQTVD